MSIQYSHLIWHRIRLIDKSTLHKNNDCYDIVIIGAGIQGAGIAQAAAVSGYKTLVIEKSPAAGMGTSCKSSKLIHGGLRYLESGQFGLVKECLTERKRLLKNAPELVKLIPFYIPVYSHNSRPDWMIWLGLSIYTFFSLKPFKIIPKKQWPLLDHIKTKNLKRVFKYFDAQTDDQLLTQSVAKSAQSYSAKIIYNAHFISSSYQHELHLINYITDKNTYSIKSKYIINCSGPWVKETQEKIHPKLNLPAIELISGSHIIVDINTTQGAYYLETKDNRAVFVIPWKEKHTLIGTTETTYTGTADNVTATKKDIDYLINVYNQNFSTHISSEDIIDSFCGLRVLPKDNDSIFNKSRDSLIIEDENHPGLITLIGGKLTAYRANSELVISKINIKNKRPTNNTREIKLGS